MRFSVRHIWVLLLAMLSLTACRNNDILSVNQMVDVLFDIYRLEGTLTQLHRPVVSEQKMLYYENIFARHNTTKEEFDRSLKWYADHPASWNQVYELLEKKGEQYADSVKNKELPQLKDRKNKPAELKSEPKEPEILQPENL